MDLGLEILGELFDNLPIGVIALDPAGRVVVFNHMEEKMAGRLRADVLGTDFFVSVAPCMNVKQLAGEFRAKIGREKLDVSVEFSFAFPFNEQPRDVRVRMMSFEATATPHAFLMLEDLSFQKSVERMRETLQNLLVHDLKNPLAAISGNLGFLKELTTVRDNADAAEAIGDALLASDRLQTMLLNLLDITRLETNTLPLRRAPVELGDVLARVAEDNRAHARLHGARITVDLARPIKAWIDESLVRRALDNLVENAVRHAKEVVLSARVEGDALVLEVRDDGPGIPDAVRERIFEQYSQVTGSSSSASGHNRGLGLTFVRLAARAHGGEAAVSSPQGGGSLFRVTLQHKVGQDDEQQ